MRQKTSLPLAAVSSLAARPDLTAALVNKEQHIRALQGETAAQSLIIASLREQFEKRQADQRALETKLAEQQGREQALRAAIDDMMASLSWRFAQRLRSWRLTIAPFGTVRDRILSRLRRAMHIWQGEGLAVLVTRVALKFATKPPIEPPPVIGPGPVPLPCFTPEPTPPSLRVLSPQEAALLSGLKASKARNIPAIGKPIDILIPLNKGRIETLSCLRAVLNSTNAATFEIVAINYSHPDAVLLGAIRELAAAGVIHVVDPAPRKDAVSALNQGMQLHPDRDLILLNAEAEVYADWVDRLYRAAYSAANIAAVTSLTNDESTGSYPAVCRKNTVPGDLSPERLDRLCAEHNADCHVDVPTSDGPCLYVRRDALTAAGAIKEEELDLGRESHLLLCQRASQAGWRHVLATDTYVYRQNNGRPGTGTLEDQRAAKTEANASAESRVLLQAYIQADPALPARRRLDLARLLGPEPAMLFITHGRGGGTERHVADLAARLEGEGMRALILRPAAHAQVQIERWAIRNTPNLVYALPGEAWTLREALRALGVQHVHVHHVIDHPLEVLDLIRDLELPYDWTVHDYYAICPRLNLVDESGLYCGEPDASRCHRCLEKPGYDAWERRPEIGGWRDRFHELLLGARRVLVLHEDVANRLRRYFPELSFVVRPPTVTTPNARMVAKPYVLGESLRVAVIGYLTPHKGSAIVHACAQNALARGLPLQFCIVGATYPDGLFAGMPNVAVTGPYSEEEVFDLLDALGCHVALFPSICPETYSYTLSIALQGGLVPLAFDLGAPAARIRETGFGSVLPLTASAATINQELLALASRECERGRVPREFNAPYQSLVADYYELRPREAA